MNTLVLAAALLATSESITTVSDFTYIEEQDPITDSLILGIQAESEEATLFVGCDHSRSKTIYVVFETKRFLAPSNVAQNPRKSGDALADFGSLLGSVLKDRFLYRIDEGKAHDGNAEYIGLTQAFLEGRVARAFAQRLAKGQSVFIRVNGVSGHIDTRYHIAGIGPLIERVAQRCGDNRLAKRLANASR